MVHANTSLLSVLVPVELLPCDKHTLKIHMLILKAVYKTVMI